MWLLDNGWGNLQILPYVAPSGGYWRCEFHPPGKPSLSFFRYSSSSEHRYLENHCGGSVRKNIRAEALAQAIMVSVPDDMQERCKGPCSFDTLAWQMQLLDQLDRGLLPAAFHEYTSDYSCWELSSPAGGNHGSMAPQPGYVPPSQEPNWTESSFWRGPLGAVTSLERKKEFLISFSDPIAVNRVATELARVIKDGGEQYMGPAFKAAIAALARAG